MLRGMKENLPYIVERLPELPALLYDALKNNAAGVESEKQIAEIKHIRDEIKKGNQRSIIAIIGASLLMSAFIVFGVDSPNMILGVPAVSWVLGGAGTFFLLFALQE